MTEKNKEILHTERARSAFRNLLKDIPAVDQIFEDMIAKLPADAFNDLLKTKLDHFCIKLEMRRRALETACEIDRQERLLQANVALAISKCDKD